MDRHEPKSRLPEPTADQIAALKRVQAIARKYLPEGVSLSQELMDGRRKEAARE